MTMPLANGWHTLASGRTVFFEDGKIAKDEQEELLDLDAEVAGTEEERIALDAEVLDDDASAERWLLDRSECSSIREVLRQSAAIHPEWTYRDHRDFLQSEGVRVTIHDIIVWLAIDGEA